MACPWKANKENRILASKCFVGTTVTWFKKFTYQDESWRRE